MKKIIIIASLLIAFASNVARAQCYEVVQMPYYPFPYQNGTFLPLSDDQYSAALPIGFDFCFFGQTYQYLVVGSNGCLSFDLNLAMGYCPWSIIEPIPTPSAPLNAIMGPWQDINPGLGGAVVFNVYGYAPYRKFVLSYYQVPMYSCTNLQFSNQIVLYETLNVIDINIASKPLCPTWNNGSAIEGIQNADGTEAYVVPGRNVPNQWMSTGDSYRFIPQCYCTAPDGLLTGNVSGSAFWDFNQDCIRDAGEPGIGNVKFDVQPNNGTIWSGYQGNLAFMAEPGPITLQFSADNPWYLTNPCPAGAVPIDVLADSTVGPYNWGFDIIPYQDVTVSIGSTNIATCFHAQQLLNVCNQGNVPAQNVGLNVTLPSVLSNATFSIPFSSNMGNSYHWDIPWLDAGECLGIFIADSVNCVGSLVGQTACFTAGLTLEAEDSDTTNNIDNDCRIISASYDPNDKQVRVAGASEVYEYQNIILPNDRLEYMIRFQNTGSAPAYNIHIDDILPPQLDRATIQPGASSHAFTLELVGNVLRFHFPAIMLPDSASDPVGSQGWVRFTIGQMANNQPGTVIQNSAAIYFDNNEPVLTNPAISTILMVGLDEAKVNPLVIQPNPAQHAFAVKGLNGQSMLEVLGTDGKVIKTVPNYMGEDVSLSDLSSGVYVLRITGSTVVWVARLVKQ